jgi:hypothetical protein
MSQQASTSATTPTDDRASFGDRMTDLSTGIGLLSEQLGLAFDMAKGLGHASGEDGWYVMNAITETRWIAKRLSESIAALRPSEEKFAQAAE